MEISIGVSKNMQPQSQRSNRRAPRGATPPARTIRPLAAIVCLALAGCGGGDETADDIAIAARSEQTASSTTTVPDATSTSEVDLAYAADEPQAESTTPTTAGSGLPPVTTIVGPSGGDPDNIYIGTIGSLSLDTLTLDQEVADALADPPKLQPGTHPLTGLPGELIDRPAAVVKIDNGPAASPHTGLNAADIVIEEEVEGGVTRFAAIFQSNSSIVGPVRSGRTTDVTLISSLGQPLLMYSGANDITEGILRRHSHIQNHSFATSSGYWRDESRKAPSNLYTDTAPHWASADGSAPPAQFAYRSGDTGADGMSAPEIVIDYGANRAVWHWHEGKWDRSQRGKRHLLANGEQVSAANVIILEAERVATGMTDAAGGIVPEFPFVGSGRAVVFTDGERLDGTWTKPRLGDVAVLTDRNDAVIELTPGRTWIQLVESGKGMWR